MSHYLNNRCSDTLVSLYKIFQFFSTKTLDNGLFLLYLCTEILTNQPVGEDGNPPDNVLKIQFV